MIKRTPPEKELEIELDKLTALHLAKIDHRWSANLCSISSSFSSVGVRFIKVDTNYHDHKKFGSHTVTTRKAHIMTRNSPYIGKTHNERGQSFSHFVKRFIRDKFIQCLGRTHDFCGLFRVHFVIASYISRLTLTLLIFSYNILSIFLQCCG